MIPRPGEIRSIAVTETGDLELGIGREDGYEELLVEVSTSDLLAMGAACLEAARDRIRSILRDAAADVEVRQPIDPL